MLHSDGEGLALGRDWFVEKEGDFVPGIHLGLLPAADVDSPAGAFIAVNDGGGGESGLFVVGEGGF